MTGFYIFAFGRKKMISKTLDLNKEKKRISNSKKFSIISYGCQMNVSDSEVVASILESIGYSYSDDINNSELVLLNTCSIREKAEQTVRKKLESINAVKKINKNLKVGVLGCMAERLKEKFLEEEKIVDLVVGPDAYRDIPNLLKEIEFGNDAVNVLLSKEETYADINPSRFNTNGINAFVSITRGCDNMCTFCIVPFTRGRERSRDPKSILKEINELVNNGYKEVTLLGQNVDSYLWYGGGLKKDFNKASEIQRRTSINFSKLLDLVAKNFPKTRIRFTTSNPQDIDDTVLKTMAKHNNICNHIHLPVQSGSNKILKKMNRKHSVDDYLRIVEKIRNVRPDIALSSDFIVGFPEETDNDFEDTMKFIEKVNFVIAYSFIYSPRPGTPAQNKDNISLLDKKARLSALQSLLTQQQINFNKSFVNKGMEVLFEKVGRHKDQFIGRTIYNQSTFINSKKDLLNQIMNVKITNSTNFALECQI